MADKNQLGLANGTPSQFSSANSTSLQSNFSSQNQTQLRYSSGIDQSLNYNQIKKPTSSSGGPTQMTYSSMDQGLNYNQVKKPPTSVYSGQMQMRYPSKMDHSLNSDQLNKIPTSVFNGQVSPKPKILNWPQQSGHSISNFASGTGDNTLHQHQPIMTSSQQPSPFETAKSNLAYSGNINSKVSQNIQPPENLLPSSVSSAAQQNASPNQTSTSTTQVSSNMQFGEQNIKPSPAVENKNVIPNVGIMPPTSVPSSGSGLQHHSFPKVKKVIPPISPYSGAPPNTSLRSTSQVNKPIYGPPLQTLPSNPFPISKPPVSNLTPSLYPNYMPPPAEGINSTPKHENPVQGSHSMPQPSKYQYPSASQSFLQPSQTQSNLHGIPQGYQPQPPSANQNLRQTSTLNAPLSDDNLNSKQETSTYQNQHPTNKVLGPPPTGGVPPPTTVPRLQSPFTNRLSSPYSAYGSLKQSGMSSLTEGMERMSVTQQGFNKLWGTESVDLLQCRNILPPQKVTPPPIRLNQEFMNYVNCSPEIFCCTLNKIPETNSLLQKSRLPLGILIHPFRDLSQLAVIQCSSIVRCRSCRTYINPFVYFVDNKRWKCNLCFRVNELPDEFQYDPVSKTYGDPSRRPEIRSSTIEFIAPSEYMLRPPQPAIYLFVLDVSRWGCDTGYLETFCSVLLEELDNIPGDSRTQIGFILFDSAIHFFSIAEDYNQAHEMIVSDIEDIFLPTPDTLLVNLNENRQLIKDLLHEIPKKYAESFDTDSALGPALQAAYKLMSPTGGRITVFQSCLPNKGPGALDPREDVNQRSSRDVRHLGPQTDFYKRLSLDCSTQQISVDLFLVSSQYSDLATLGGVSQFSGGCIYHFPLFRRVNPESNERLARAFKRYLTRKIGFEAVMRVRCSRGLSIHTFHGNFFVRSTDLLSLPNVNPDAGFGMQISIEDSLFELQCVCFQAAVLYTSAKGERRIRVHTLCLPVSSNLSDILTSADQQAIVGLLGKMAVDRSLKSNLSDAREAFINAAIDILSAYKLVETSGGHNCLLAPINLSLIPLYILALLKSTAFRTNQSTKLDDRVYAMSQMKTLPLRELIQLIHPDLYHVTHLDDETGVEFEEKLVPQPPKLSLSSEHLDSRGAFLLDTPEVIYLLVGKNISTEFLVNIFNVKDVRQINKDLVDLPELENNESEKLRHFINYLQVEKPWPAVIKVVTEIKEIYPFLINDKAENALSYYELLHHVKSQLK